MLRLTKNKDNRVGEESGRAVQEKPKAQSTHCVALHLLSLRESIANFNPQRCLIALGFAPPTILPSPSSVSVFPPFYFVPSFQKTMLGGCKRQASCGVSYMQREQSIAGRAGIEGNDRGPVFIYSFIIIFLIFC